MKLVLILAALFGADFESAIRQRALEATVRLRVGGSPYSLGTGVIVGTDGEGGHLILTARHVVNGDAKIVLDAWFYDGRGNHEHKASREVVAVSSKGDLALVRLKTAAPVPRGLPVRPIVLPKGRHEVLSVGCDGGSDPTVWTATATVGRARDGRGAEIIVTHKQPRKGRSGGPLVDHDGYVVGICSTGSGHNGGEGGFVGISEIHRFLSAAGYGALYGGSVASSPIKPQIIEPQPVRPGRSGRQDCPT